MTAWRSRAGMCASARPRAHDRTIAAALAARGHPRARLMKDAAPVTSPTATARLRFMRVLILGGTVCLGRHVAGEALARGHDVTLFHRGRHGADLFAGGEHVLGGRAGDLALLRDGRWDAAIDTSGYDPADVARSSALDIGHLVFVSTCNVYPRWPAEPVDKDSPVWTEGDDYGARKAACERAAEAALPGRVATLRAGLLCGPHDNVFRLPWWIGRIAAGGDVLAPGDPQQAVQLIDTRDLASWALHLAEQGVAGAFNATAPPGRTTMSDVL